MRRACRRSILAIVVDSRFLIGSSQAWISFGFLKIVKNVLYRISE